MIEKNVSPSGEISQRYADWIIITDDNPREEDPEKIIDDIQQGCPGAHRIRCRNAAIAHGIATMEQGHILLVAGKGHEAFQWIKDKAIPFQDRHVIQTLCASHNTQGSTIKPS